MMHAPDSYAGERYSTFEIPAKVGAPFRANVVSSWKYRSTTNWNRHTLFNNRTIARDGAGRVFQERRLYSPDGDKKPTTVSELDFYDPSTSVVLVFDPRSGQCTAQPYVVDRGTNAARSSAETIRGATIQRTGLGDSVMHGLQVQGTRETITWPGKTEPSTVKETWYAPRLALTMLLKRTEWNRDGQTFTVTDIDLHEPDATLFKPPAACQVR